MRKISAFVIVVAFTFCLFIQPAEAKAIFFKDVNKDSSHYDGIYYLTNEGTITGYEDNTFKPYKSITRSQTAVMFTRAMDLSIPRETRSVLKNYQDVDINHMYSDEIAATYQANIMTGSNGRFNDQSLTRAQMATVLVNAYGLEDDGTKVNAKLSNIDSSHRENVKILFQRKLTNQTGNFRPNEAVTRGQFATFLYRVAKNVEDNGYTDEDQLDNQKVFTSENDKFYIYGITLGDTRSNVIERLGKPDIEKEDNSEMEPSDFVLMYDNLEIYITDNMVDFIFLGTTQQFFNEEFKGKYISREYVGYDMNYLYDSNSSHLVYAKYDNNDYNVRMSYADGNFFFGLENGTIKPVKEQEETDKPDIDDNVQVVSNEKELKRALNSNSSAEIVELENSIELSNTITVKNEGVQIQGNHQGENHGITGAPEKTVFEVAADDVQFDNVSIFPNNGIGIHAVYGEPLQFTGGSVQAEDSLSSGIIVEDNFRPVDDEGNWSDIDQYTAVIKDSLIYVPNIGVSFAGGRLVLEDNLIDSAEIGLKFTAVESPRSIKDNSFFNNQIDISTDYLPHFEQYFHLNHFDLDSPKLEIL